MHVFDQISTLRRFLRQQKSEGKSVGLVPTMGALHAGHLSLIKACRGENEVTICSIFVNPAQFNNPSDLEKYPRTLEKDLSLLEEAGCSAVFNPSSVEMYPVGMPGISVSFKGMDEILEGEFRPGHFSGVAVVVGKLFNIVQPDRAYFGQKDLQQFYVIRQLVTDFSVQVELRCISIMREASGLAMSSRNSRLTPEEVEKAAVLYQSLKDAEVQLGLGAGISEIRDKVNKMVAGKSVKLEYFHVIDVETFSILHTVKSQSKVALCIAAYIGEVRLIDNLLIK